jgi:hypothetical protein
MSNDQDPLPEQFSDDLKPFEAMLGSLRPVASRIDRDRLMYQAGGAAASAASVPATALTPATAESRRSKQWLWPCVSAALLLIAASLGAALAFRGQPHERIVYITRPATASPDVKTTDAPHSPITAIDAQPAADDRFSEQSNLVLRERALRFGIDSIGIPSNSGPVQSTPEAGNRSLLDQMLGT